MFEKKIAGYIKKENLFGKEDKILVALSGGADSVALLCVLLSLGYRCEAAHCNFCLRGDESDRDEHFVCELCKRMNIPLRIKKFDTKKYAAKNHLSVEMAARKLRYGWFEEVRREIGATAIAVAHHRDDSVETFLLNLIRGTGINGLKGIRPKNGFIVRPLLDSDRKEILEYLSFIGQMFVTDSTNLEDEYTRNKIRLQILPQMEIINPSVKESIASTSRRLAEAATIYEKVIEEGKEKVVKDSKVSISALLQEPSPSALLFEILYPLGFNSAQINDIGQSLEKTSGKQFFSSGWGVLKDRDSLFIRPLEREKSLSQECMELSGEGEYSYGTPLRKLQIKCFPYKSDFVIPRNQEVACLDAEELVFPLVLRKWKNGDRFMPFGMKGMKKISDYLTDRKYSLYQKEEVYAVCSENRIVWLVGERIDHRFRVKETTREVVMLSIIG